MRTVQQERARFSWLSPREFGEAIGVTDQQVRELIAEGWFRTDGKVPECINVALPSAKAPRWHISPAALDRFLRERAA